MQATTSTNAARVVPWNRVVATSICTSLLAACDLSDHVRYGLGFLDAQRFLTVPMETAPRFGRRSTNRKEAWFSRLERFGMRDILTQRTTSAMTDSPFVRAREEVQYQHQLSVLVARMLDETEVPDSADVQDTSLAKLVFDKQ